MSAAGHNGTTCSCDAKTPAEVAQAMETATSRIRSTLNELGVHVDGVLIVASLSKGGVSIIGSACCARHLSPLVTSAPEAVRTWAHAIESGLPGALVGAGRDRRFDA